MGLVFSTKDLPADEGTYTVITPGQYDVQMEAVEEKTTLSGGESWSLKMKIVSDQFKGRTFFLNYNVTNASEKTQQIARREVAQIASLIGVTDDISINSIKTNKVFTITLENRANPSDSSKVFYNARSWKLKNEVAGIKAVQDKLLGSSPTTTAPKKPWIK